ncbi:MAG: hypothetical protein ACRC50_00205 [Gaiella sp.]
MQVELVGLSNGTWLLVVLAVALYALVVWMLLEILFRADFGWGMKIAWCAAALLFAPIAVPVWFLWVRNKDYSLT